MIDHIMTSNLISLCFDANDPRVLAQFWAEALGWTVGEESEGEVALVPTDGTRFELLFLAVPEPKVGKNRIHLDLTSTSLDDQRRSVERLLALGASHVDVGQTPGRRACRARRPGRQRAVHHRAGQQLPRDVAVASGRSRATAPSRSATSGAPRSAGRSCGTRTPKLRSARPTVPGPSSRGDRPWSRRSPRTGCTSTSRRPPTVTSSRGGAARSRSVPGASKSVRAT